MDKKIKEIIYIASTISTIAFLVFLLSTFFQIYYCGSYVSELQICDNLFSYKSISWEQLIFPCLSSLFFIFAVFLWTVYFKKIDILHMSAVIVFIVIGLLTFLFAYLSAYGYVTKMPAI